MVDFKEYSHRWPKYEWQEGMAKMHQGCMLVHDYDRPANAIYAEPRPSRNGCWFLSQKFNLYARQIQRPRITTRWVGNWPGY